MQSKKIAAITLAALLGAATFAQTTVNNVFAKENAVSLDSAQIFMQMKNSLTKAATDIVEIPDAMLKNQINTYLKHQSDADITVSDMEKVLSLSVDIGKDKVKNLSGLEYAVNLKTLELNGGTEVNLEPVCNLKKLENLSVSYAPLDFSVLGAMPKLTEIYIFSVDTVENLNWLTAEKYPQLKKLTCSRCKNLSSISTLKQDFKHLEYLDLEGENKIEDLSPIAGKTSLKTLKIEKIRINDQNRTEYINTIKSLTSLTYLFMPYCYIQDSDTVMFEPLVNLKKLVLNMNGLTNTKFCDKLPADLEALCLTSNNIKNMDNLARFQNLRILGLSDNDVSDLSFIKSLKKLTNDDIRHAEGTESFPTKEFHNVGSPKVRVEADETLVVKNPYIGVDGNKVSFKNAEVEGIDKSNVHYDESADEIAITNLTGSNNITLKQRYNVNLPNSEVKVFDLYIQIYTREKPKYTVTYDWGKDAPQGEILPNDTNKYKSEQDALKAVDTAYTKDRQCKEVVDGISGSWIFSGWERAQSADSLKVKFVGSWTFRADMLEINNCPIIEAEDAVLTVGDEFDVMKGIKAFDAEDGDLTENVEVLKNDVDTSKPGVYDVVYEVMDGEGAKCEKSIRVSVNEKEVVIIPPESDTEHDTDAPQTGDMEYVFVALCGILAVFSVFFARLLYKKNR